MFKYQHWTSPVFFPKSTFFLWSTHYITDSPSLRVQKFTVHGTIFFFLPRSEQPSSVVIYWINLKLLLSAWLSLRRQRFSWWELMLSCSMDGKKQEKKSTSYRFLETLADSSFPKLFLKVCVGFSSSFWPIILSLSLKSCYWMIQRLMQWQPQLGCLWIQICGCEAASKGHRPAAGHLSGPPSGRRGTVW